MSVEHLLNRLREMAATMEAEAAPAPPAMPWGPAPLAAAPPEQGRTARALLDEVARGHLGWGGVLAMPEGAFLPAAYGFALGRLPDPAAEASFGAARRAGESRLALVLALAGSPEGQARGRGALGGWPRLEAWGQHLLRWRNTSSWPGVARACSLLLRGLEAALAGPALRRQVAGLWALACAADAQLQGQDVLLAALRRDGARPALDLAGLREALQGPADANAPPPEALDAYLQALEVHFRGAAAGLEAQWSADYGPALEAWRCTLDAAALAAPCVDLGCGRGAWLAWLGRRGLRARGVDLNAGPVSEARARGLDAEVGDALAWLRAQPEGSLLMVSAFHLMEHLPFALRFALVAEAARALRPGGLLLLETPNPENVWVATHTYHHDPTHRQPLTPDGLAFLVRYHGLEAVEVLRLHPMPAEAALPVVDATSGRLNHMTCGPQDFAVLARKPGKA